MSLSTTVMQNLVHVGAVLFLICFLFRDQVYLRAFAIAADTAYVAYYYGAAERPLWEAMAWSALTIVINIVMMTLLLRDRRMTAFTDDEMSLYQNLKGLNPGQFRRLMKSARWQTLGEPQALTREGEMHDRLHYVLRGTLEIAKSGRIFAAASGAFVGELAYLRKKPATATVTAARDAVVVSWNHADLQKISARDEGFANAFAGLLSADLAEKVART